MRLPTKDAILAGERKSTREYGEDAGDKGIQKRRDVTTAKQEKLDNFTYYKRVSDYLLGKTIGEGSFARVRLGLHVPTAQEVAVKIINKAKAAKDAYVHKNLRREGRILQMARHENIVQVYDILETNNNYYLVTEYCGGGELIDIVTDRGGLPEVDVRKYVSQLVSAVAHLHDHGIVHRDLKVENLILDEFGDLKVIDFGLSNVVPTDVGYPHGALSTQCGSPAYAAPELLAKKPYGPNVDVWSIGVITYAMIVGKLPFSAEPFRIPVLCRKMMAGDMNPIPSHLTSNCRTFIKRLLTPDPKSRPRIHQVQEMPWVETLVKLSTGTLYSPREQKTNLREIVDDVIVSEMSSEYGFNSAKVANCVHKNRPGEALTMYLLLSKQRILCKKTCKKTCKTEMNSLIENDKDKNGRTPFNMSVQPSDSHTNTQKQSRSATDCDQPTTATPIKKESHNTPAAKQPLPISDPVIRGPHPLGFGNGIQENHICEKLTTTATPKIQRKPKACTGLHGLQPETPPTGSTCESPKNDATYPDKETLNIQKRLTTSGSSQSFIRGEITTIDTKEKNETSNVRIDQSENKEKVAVETTTNTNRDFGSRFSQSTYRDNTLQKYLDRVGKTAPPHEPLKLKRAWSNKTEPVQNHSVSSRDSRQPSNSMSKRSNKITPLFTSIFHRHRQGPNTKALNSHDSHVRDRQVSRRCGTELPVISVQGTDVGATPDLPRIEPRYKSKTFTSREMTKYMRNRGSVKEMIEKFDGMKDNDLSTSCQISRVTVNPTRPNTVVLYEKNHSRTRSEATEKLQYGRPRLPVNQQFTATKYRSKGKEPYSTGKYENSNFLFFFRGRNRDAISNTGTYRALSPTKDTKQPVRGTWHKSLV